MKIQRQRDAFAYRFALERVAFLPKSYEKAAYSDQTRFQQDFAEDLKSGEPLDEQQKRFIEYLRRFDDMVSNARGEYTPRGGWPQ